MGHQVSPPAPITALSGLISALLNNGTAVYEMGMSSNAIERLVIETVCNKIGYNNTSGGFLTSGGTLANLTALLSAQKAITKRVIWNDGKQNQLGIMVSKEAHNCVDRAARIMGLGEKVIIKICDNGVGINKNSIDKIFDLYYRANNGDIPGTGLWLYRVKNIIEDLRGGIKVISDKNIGTGF